MQVRNDVKQVFSAHSGSIQIEGQNLGRRWTENTVGLGGYTETLPDRFSDTAYAYQEALPLVPAGRQATLPAAQDAQHLQPFLSQGLCGGAKVMGRRWLTRAGRAFFFKAA